MNYKCWHCGKESVIDAHRKSNKYCSNRCQIDYQNQKKIDEWLSTGILNRVGTAPWLKKYILDKQDGRCLECGISSWQGKPLILDLEHKDGNSDNNAESNLCCLCPNCHSQTETYKAKNKGRGRKARRNDNLSH
jgi:hypothetical protein